MNPTLVILLVAFLFSSCAVVGHWDEATTLQEYSSERDALAAMVRERDGKFDALLMRIASGDTLVDLGRREDLLERLGEPVLVAPLTDGGARMERWLYRYQTKGLGSPKVYFMLNESGDVLSWSREDAPAPTGISQHATANP